MTSRVWLQAEGRAAVAVPNEEIAVKALQTVLGFIPSSITLAGYFVDVNEAAKSTIGATAVIAELRGNDPMLGTTNEKAIQVTGEHQGEAGDAGLDDTAGFLRGILPLGILPGLDELRNLFTAGLHKDGRRVLLPVSNFTYSKLVSDTVEWRNWIQPVSKCNAHYLAEHISSILNKRTSQPGSELVMPAVIDSMVYDIMQLLADHLGGVPMKRHRNQTEASLTWSSLRPDFWLLVAGTMLFKGEDKTKDHELTAARQDLLSKMKDWDPAYHGTVGRLPPDHRVLGYTDMRPHGTTITMLDSSVLKEVDCAQHPLLNIIKDRMHEVYAAAQDCPNLVHAMRTYPKLRGDKYCVALVPVGTQLTVGSFPVHLMRVAVRCVLTALSALHKAGYGHGDLRWENVIWVSDTCFVVIDLEGTISLASQQEQQQVLRCEPTPHAWGANKEALVDRKFTAASDLYMLGCMLQQIQQKHAAAVPELDDGLVQALLRKEVSLEQAQAHAWLQE